MICSTDDRQWQKSEPYGAGILQETSHLRQLPSTLDGARHDTLRQMQSSSLEVSEIPRAPELRAGCQSGRLRAVPQAARDPDEQALPTVPRSTRSAEATQQMKT